MVEACHFGHSLSDAPALFIVAAPPVFFTPCGDKILSLA